jgi:hypothetical protein
LPVSDVVDYTYKVTSALIGKPGLIARVPINTNVYPDGIPHTLRLQVTLAPKLAEDCDLARHFDRFRQRVHSKGYEQEDGGAALIETRRSDVKGVQLFDLDREGDYRLDVYLVAKKTAAQPEIAKKLILDERRMTVIEDPLP